MSRKRTSDSVVSPDAPRTITPKFDEKNQPTNIHKKPVKPVKSRTISGGLK
jgi:hypothetical protein